jgi:hypothetical protein
VSGLAASGAIASALPNPRMQPTGRSGAGRRAGGTLRWRGQNAWVCAGAGLIARS